MRTPSLAVPYWMAPSPRAPGSGARPCLAAGLGVARAVRRLEAGTAGAALHRVWVEDREAALHQVLDVVDLGAVQQRGAFRVDEEGDAPGLDGDVVVLPVAGDRHAVLVAGATAA